MMLITLNEQSSGTVPIAQEYVSLSTDSLPFGWGEDSDDLAPMMMPSLVASLYHEYSTHAPKTLNEISAKQLVENWFYNDLLEMDEIIAIKFTRYHTFTSAKIRKLWHALELLYDTWKQRCDLIEAYIVVDDPERRRIPHNTWNAMEWLQPTRHFCNRLSPFGIPCTSHYSEYKRVMIFDNGCIFIRYGNLLCSTIRSRFVAFKDVGKIAHDDWFEDKSYNEITSMYRTKYCQPQDVAIKWYCYHFHRLKKVGNCAACWQPDLTTHGDVESNPGPNTKEQQRQIVELKRQVRQLLKQQQKHANHVQRQIETEKMARKRNRKESAWNKRHAQGVRQVVDNLRTDAAYLLSDAAATSAIKTAAIGAVGVVSPAAAMGIAAAQVHGKTNTILNDVQASTSKIRNEILADVQETTGMFRNMMTQLTSSVDSIKSLFKMPEDCDVISILINLISLVSAFLDKSMLLVSLHALQLARALKVDVTNLMDLLPSFSSDNKSASFSGTHVSQSILTDMFYTAKSSTHLYPIAGILSFFCGVFNLLCTGYLPTPTEMVKHFSNVGRAATGFRSLKELFSWVYGYVAEIYYTTVYGMTTEEYKFMEEYPQLENLFAAVRIIEDLDIALIDSSVDLTDQILIVAKELDEYATSASRAGSTMNKNFIGQLQRRIANQIKSAKNCTAKNHAIRESPIAIYLYGLPGVGKSVLTEVLQAKIYKDYLTEYCDKYESVAYTRNVASEYWEGYCDQPIVIYDDFGNVKDSVAKPVPEYVELERMVNTASFPLNMAFDSKGKATFKSKFVIASSNQKFPDIKHMVAPGAIYRRFHIWADIRVKQQFGAPLGRDQKGNPYYVFNREAAAAALGVPVSEVPPLLTDHYVIDLYKVTYDSQKGQADVSTYKTDLTFDEFYSHLCTTYETMRTTNKGLSRAIRELVGIAEPIEGNTASASAHLIAQKLNPSKFIDVVAEAKLNSPKPVALQEETEDDPLIDDDTSNESEVESNTDGESITSESTTCGNFLNDVKYTDSKGDDEFDLSAHLSSYLDLHNLRKQLKARFDELRVKCRNLLTDYTSKLADLYSSACASFRSMATLILSTLSSFSTSIISYFPSIPTYPLLTGLCTCILAVGGAWYAGLFRYLPGFRADASCQFNRSPHSGIAPCRDCKACTEISYPKTGDMCMYFVQQTRSEKVRKALYALGFTETEVFTAREEAAKVKPEPVAQALFGDCLWYKYVQGCFPAHTCAEAKEIINSQCQVCCKFCGSIQLLNLKNDEDYLVAAQELYTLEVSPTGYPMFSSDPDDYYHEHVAQRVYENAPVKPKNRSLAQRVYDKAPVKARAGRVAQSGRTALITAKTEMQIGACCYAQRDQVRVEQSTQVLLNNAVWIQVVDTAGMCSKSNGVFLVGRTMLTTAHTVLIPPGDAPFSAIVIRNPYSSTACITVPYNECKITQLKHKDGRNIDLALITFPPVVANRPKILSKFIDAKNIGYLQEGTLVYSGFYEKKKDDIPYTVVQEYHITDFNVTTKDFQYAMHEPGKCPKSDGECTCCLTISNHVEYDLQTFSGMCGSLLSVQNQLVHTKLIGFHVAGGVGVTAIGCMTTRQFLEDELARHVADHEIPPSYIIDGRLPYSQSFIDHSFQAALTHEGDCISIGKAKQPISPSKTQLGPSLVHGMIQESICKPAHLSPVVINGERIDPMIKGIRKVLGPQQWVDSDLLDAAINDVFEKIGSPVTGTGIVHSYEEAICGIQGDAYKRPINRTTSPGYPYNLTNKKKGKTAWLGEGEEYDLTNVELRTDVENLIDHSRQGRRGDAISCATLKDEKRPIAKVEEGKTRVFEACPQHLVIAIRQYFLDFAAHVMRRRIDNGIAVGINPYSLEWTRVANLLLAKGNNMIAGDFSNFDGSLLMQIMVRICEKINDWYDDGSENALIRTALWDHICNADVLVQGDVIRKTHSQPSGNPLTVIINSIFNATVMRIAYMMLKKEQGLAPTCDYRKYVSEIIYGDDDIKSVHSSIASWFNQLTLTKALAEIGLTYTDETKTGKILPFKPLEEVAFLKRKFVEQEDGTYMAPMDLANVLEITNWISGKAKRQATQDNCEQAIFELGLHDRETYNYYSNKIKKACTKQNVPIHVPTFSEQRAEYRLQRDVYARCEYVPLW